MKTKQLLFAAVSFVAAVIVTGCVFDSLEMQEDSSSINTSVVTATVTMPDSTPLTRISLEEDGISIDLSWEEGDKLSLLIVYGEYRKTQTVPVTILPGDSKKATFSFELPSGNYETFDLYAIYGGGGFLEEYDENYKVTLLDCGYTTSSNLADIAKKKSIILAFSKMGISRSFSSLSLELKHIGSFFNIQLKNTGSSVLKKVTEVRLAASSDMPAYNISATHRYNVITGEFSGAQAKKLIFKPVSSSNIVPEGVLEFWGWIPMHENADWPELNLEIESNTTTIATTIPKNERTATVGQTYRLYATYDGSSLSFATSAAITVPVGKAADFRDGYLYNTVTIGNQVWLGENLKYLPKINDVQDNSYMEPCYYVYGYPDSGVPDVAEAKTTDNYKTYGVMYNWPATMTFAASSKNNPSGVQGACPKGWHVPSRAEWDELKNNLGHVGGAKLKEAGSEHWDAPNSGDTYLNQTGFTALPGGIRYNGDSMYSLDRNFYFMGNRGQWWSATEPSHTTQLAGEMSLYWNLDDIYQSNYAKDVAISVRCVKD